MLLSLEETLDTKVPIIVNEVEEVAKILRDPRRIGPFASKVRILEIETCSLACDTVETIIRSPPIPEQTLTVMELTDRHLELWNDVLWRLIRGEPPTIPSLSPKAPERVKLDDPVVNALGVWGTKLIGPSLTLKAKTEVAG